MERCSCANNRRTCNRSSSAAVETARPLIDERRHQLVSTFRTSCSVNGDPLRLAQVLSNLLTNAAKYTNPQGTIRVTGAQQDDESVDRRR